MDFAKILLEAGVDAEKSVSNINSTIQEMQSKLNKINLNIKMDNGSEIDKVTEKIERLNKALQGSQGAMSLGGMDSSVRDGISSTIKATDDLIEKERQHNQSLEEKLFLYKHAKELQMEDLKIKYAEGLDASQLEDFNKRVMSLSEHTADVTSQMKFLDAEFKEIRQESRLATQEAKAQAKAEEDRLKAIAKTQEEKARQSEREAKELTKLEGQLASLEKREAEQNKTLEERIAIWQRIKEIQVNELEFKMGDTVEVERLKNLVSGVQQVSTETDRASHVMREWDTELRAITSNARLLATELKDMEKLETQAEKEAESTKKQNEELERKIELFKRAMAIDIDKFQAKFGDAIDVDKLDQFTNKVKSLSTDTKDADKTIEMLRMEFKELNHETAMSVGAIDGANASIKQIGDSAESSFKKMMSFVGVQVSLYALFNQIKQGVGQINQLDDALTQISIVTGKSRDEVSGLAREYNDLAKEMSVTTDAVAQGAVLFYRQGLEQEEVMNRLQATTEFSKITNLDFVESAELLTATVNSMGVSVQNASDTFSYLGDATATSGAEVAKGFSKTSGTAKALGLELEKVSSYIAGISATTRQNAESIGTAINAIFSRMTNLTAKGFTEEGESINNVAKALKEVGIVLEESPGVWRKQTDVLDDVAKKWDTMNDRQRSYLATTIAGTRQQSTFNNLMENYALTMDLYEGAMDSAGTAQEKYGLYLESNQAKIDQFKATVEELWMTLIDSDALMSMLDGLTRLIETVIAVTDAYGGLIKELIAFGVPAIAVVGVLNMIYNGLSKFATVAKLVTTQIGVMTGAIQGTSVIAMALNPVIAGLTLVVAGLGYAFVKSAKEAREADEAFRNAHKNIGSLTDEVVELGKLEAEYRDLSRTTKKTTEEKERLLEIQRQLARIHPELATGYDAEGNKIAENVEMTTNLLRAKEELLAQDQKSFDIISKQRIPQLNEDIAQLEARRKQLIALIEQGEGVKGHYVTEGGIKKYVEAQSVEDLSVELSNVIEKQQEMRQEQAQIEAQSRLTAEALDRQAEASKWLKVEEIARTIQMSETKEATEEQRQALINMGFSLEDIALIAKGSLTEVKERHELASQASLDHLRSLDSLDEQSRVTFINMLNDSANATRQLISDSIARIKALKAEASAMARGAIAQRDFLDDYNSAQKARNKSLGIDGMTGAQKSPETIYLETKSSEYQKLTKSASQYQQSLGELESTIAHLESLRGTATSGRSAPARVAPSKSNGTKKAKTKKEYTAEADRYAELNALLTQNNTLVERNRIEREKLQSGTQNMLDSLDEEVTLNKQRQRILHELNQERRDEVLEIEQRLKGMFKFEGEGDNKVITNLEAVQGKSKEVEEDVKRFIDLQTNLLPSASTEWATLQRSIEKIKLEVLSNQFEMFDKKMGELTDTMSELDHQMKMLEEGDLDGKLDITARQLGLARVEAERFGAELKRLQEVEIKEGSEEFYMYQERIKEVEQAYRSAELSVKGFSDAITEMRENLRKSWVAEQNKQLQEQENALSSIQERLVQIIRKRGEAEKKAIDEAHKKDMESLKQRHDERKKRYKEDLDEYNKFIQAKIDMLQEQHAEEDYEADLERERQRALELQKEIDILSMDDSIQARTKVIELRKKLAEQNEKITKKQQDRERKIEIDALKDKMKDRQDDAKNRDETADQWYENERKRLEEDYQINKEHLDKKYSDEQVYAEARESIIRGTVEVSEGAFMDIYDAFAEFEDKFGKGMGILGDIIKEDFIAELEKAREAIARLEADGDRWLRKYGDTYDPGDESLGWKPPKTDDYYKEYGGGEPVPVNKPADFRGWSDPDFNQYIANKQGWEKADEKGRELLAMENAMLRKKYWGVERMWEDKYHWKQLIGSYDKGGFIPRDGIIMAHEQEMYIPNKMQQDLWSAFNDMPGYIDDQLKNLEGQQGNTVVNMPVNIHGNLDNVTLGQLDRTLTERFRQYDVRKEINLMKKGLR